MAKIEHPRVPVDAIVNLVNHQKQCDQDGVMVQVSRQALAEVLIYVKEVRPDNKWADTGDVAKKPNNDGLPEMLEAARTELRKAVAKVASLEAEKSDLVDIIWRQMQQAEAHTFAPAQPLPVTVREVDDALAAFGRAVTETTIQRPMRIEAENKLRDFLQALRGRIAAGQSRSSAEPAQSALVPLKDHMAANVPLKDHSPSSAGSVVAYLHECPKYGHKPTLSFKPATNPDWTSEPLYRAGPQQSAGSEVVRLRKAMHDAFMAMCSHRDSPDAEVFQDAIDALGMACGDINNDPPQQSQVNHGGHDG